MTRIQAIVKGSIFHSIQARPNGTFVVRACVEDNGELTLEWDVITTDDLDSALSYYRALVANNEQAKAEA